MRHTKMLQTDPAFWQARQARINAHMAKVAADVARIGAASAEASAHVNPTKLCRVCDKPHRSAHGRCWACRRDGRTLC